jgi:hypothetical protein
LVPYAIAHGKIFSAAISAGAGGPEPGSAIFNRNTTFETVYARGLGRWWEDPSAIARWQAVSPSLRAKCVAAPLLMQAPESEASAGVQLFRALKEVRRPVEYWVFPDEFHLFAWPSNKQVIFEQSLDWYRFWLQDYEDPLPSKRDQYQRWRRLREQRGSTTVEIEEC